MIKRLGAVLCATLLVGSGCAPSSEPATKATSSVPVAAPAEAGRDFAPAERESIEPDWPIYTPEQAAAARDLATELGVALREDDEGNVIGLDTAVNRSWVDNYQMEEMLAFPRLASLTLEGPSIDDALAPRIAKQVGLTALVLRNTLITDAGIAQFTPLDRLRAIDLRLCPLVTDAALETLVAMPSLRAVRLSGTNVTDQGIERLLALPHLTELDVRNCRNVTRSGLAQLIDKASLRTLKVGGQTIDDETVAVLAELTQLIALSLDNCDLSEHALVPLGGLSLADLTVFQCPRVTDEGLAILSRWQNLRHLVLRDVAVTGTVLALLPNPERLVSLNLAQSRITDAQIEHLRRLIGLETLVLSETAVTDVAVGDLAHLTSLKQLVLTQTGVTPDGIERLRQALPHCEIRAN